MPAATARSAASTADASNSAGIPEEGRQRRSEPLLPYSSLPCFCLCQSLLFHSYCGTFGPLAVVVVVGWLLFLCYACDVDSKALS